MKNQWYSITTSHGDEAMCWDGFAIYRDDHDGNHPERFDSDELAAEYPVDALEISRTIEASDWYCDAVADALARTAGTETTLTERALTGDEAARVARLVPLLAALCEVSHENVRVTATVDPSGRVSADAWLVQTRHGDEWRGARVHERGAVTSGADDMLSTVEVRVARWAFDLRKTMRDELRWEKEKYERLLARADAIDAGIEKASGR